MAAPRLAGCHRRNDNLSKDPSSPSRTGLYSEFVLSNFHRVPCTPYGSQATYPLRPSLQRYYFFHGRASAICSTARTETARWNEKKIKRSIADRPVGHCLHLSLVSFALSLCLPQRREIRRVNACSILGSPVSHRQFRISSEFDLLCPATFEGKRNEFLTNLIPISARCFGNEKY